MKSLVLVASACLLIQAVLCTDENIQESVTKGLADSTVNLLKLFYKINPEKNLIFSSFNIYSALALVHLASSGETQKQLSQFLGVPIDAKNKQSIHETISALIKKVENTTEMGFYTGKGFEQLKVTTIETGNGVFVQKGFNVKQTYISDVQNYYSSNVDQVDYAKEPEKATNTINEYVSKKTKGLIPKVLSETLPTDTLIILAATLYFKGSWSEKFYERSTKLEEFNAVGGTVKAHIMQNRDEVPYIKDSSLNADAIGLSYDGYDAWMYFVLPQEGQSLKTLIDQLKSEDLNRIASDSEPTYVDYKIPRVEFEWSANIISQLKDLGIQRLFEKGKAELDQLSDKSLYVDQVTHSAKITINENGTEAAAATIIKVVPMSARIYPKPIEFHINKPFLFFIYHQMTKSVLFVGSVSNPNSSG